MAGLQSLQSLQLQLILINQLYKAFFCLYVSLSIELCLAKNMLAENFLALGAPDGGFMDQKPSKGQAPS